MSDLVYIVAGGPSLRDFDWSRLSHYEHVIAINNAAFKLPHAKYVYFADRDWADRWSSRLDKHPGKKIQGVVSTHKWDHVPGVEHWTFDFGDGLSLKPRHLKPGSNSGYAAINLAVQLGYKRLRLLGYDMSNGGNWHDDHVWTEHRPDVWLPRFDTLVQPLKDLGVEVVNLTPNSNLTVFPRGEISEVPEVQG